MLAALVIPFHRNSFILLAVPLGALGFLLWINGARLQHLHRVSALGGWSDRPVASKAFAGAKRSEGATGNGLIVPEHLTASYHWMAQTQQMFAHRAWRVRHIDYENAPYGRAVYSASPYRWWLGTIAWCHHLISGRTPAESVERAAQIADPLLHVLLLGGVTLFVAWRFGGLSAAVFSPGAVMLFPFASEFLPGAPDDHGLSLLCALMSVLLLVGGVQTANVLAEKVRSTRLAFILAGVAGGVGVWINLAVQIPVLIGVVAGALLAAWVTRGATDPGSESSSAVLPWRAWSIAGAVTVFVAYGLEFAPAHLGGWHLEAIHPLYGLAWWGGGEILRLASQWIRSGKVPRTAREATTLALSAGAVAALPITIWKVYGREFFDPSLAMLRLSRIPEGAVAQDFGRWIVREGATLQVVATALPLLLLCVAVWLLIRKRSDIRLRLSLALAIGPTLVAFLFACRMLGWWSVFDALLLVLVVTATGGIVKAFPARRIRAVWMGAVSLCLLPGLWLMTARARAGAKEDLTQAEVYALVDRDLATSLALRAEAGAVVLAPPNETTALCYYGGLRGIGTLSLENKDGVAAAVRILGASTAQEAKELIDQRGITHLVLLSWDSYFDQYARSGTGQIEGTFRQQLQLSTLPSWLRPVVYRLPTIAGFEGQAVSIYEVVEEQDEATAASRIVEYLVEVGDLDQAATFAQTLRRFPGDFVAWVARAEVELARSDDAGLAKSLKFIQARLASRTAPVLPWDLRVGLAVVLAKTKQTKLAIEQVKTCFQLADEKKLSSLPTGALYRLMVLSRAFEIAVEPRLREHALGLLPGDLRERLK